MKTVLTAALAVLLSTAVSFPSGTRAAELRMSYNSDWPPYSSGVGETVKGILPDLMTEIVGKRMGMKVRHLGYPWKRVQRAVELGSLDAMVTVPTDARLNYARSSRETVYTVEMRPVVVRGSGAEQQIGDAPVPATLRRLRVCDIIGNGWGKRFAEQHGLAPIMATKASSCLRMVARGRTDVTVQATAVANKEIAVEALQDRLAVLPVPLGSMEFTLLLSRRSALGDEFMEKFDDTVRGMIADGSYQALIERLQGGAKD